MPEPHLEAVADAGPLIHLDEAGATSTLDIFRRVMVPAAVHEELAARPGAAGSDALARGTIEPVALERVERDAAIRWAGHHGISYPDATVLSVARNRDVPIVATDDLDVREAAHMHGLRPVGSVGIVLRAANDGAITPERGLEALDALRADSTLFITKPLVEGAKRTLRAALDLERQRP